ncbi:MAG: hypothetical protein ON057_001972 [Glomeribacter sp. 1016415]|nr:hypothetical protein [Glomeribacter sp. 1016415]
MAALEHWDAAGVWAFSPNTLKLLFPGDGRARLKALSAHQKLDINLSISLQKSQPQQA